MRRLDGRATLRPPDPPASMNALHYWLVPWLRLPLLAAGVILTVLHSDGWALLVFLTALLVSFHHEGFLGRKLRDAQLQALLTVSTAEEICQDVEKRLTEISGRR